VVGSDVVAAFVVGSGVVADVAARAAAAEVVPVVAVAVVLSLHPPLADAA